MKLITLQFFTIMLYALVMGVFWGTWFAHSRTMDLLGPATFLENARYYIDNQFKTWTLENLPSDWAQIRVHWESFHCLRTWVSIAGFAALVGGTLASRSRKRI